MNRVRVETPSRLHFGLLGWGPEVPRRYGSVGLMIDRPGIVLEAHPADAWHAEGPLAARALDVARHLAGRLSGRGIAIPPAALTITQAPPEHVGLGTGTQLSLAVARALLELAELPALPAPALAELTGRGRRSGVGLHGFDRGGLIVDGGRGAAERPPPLIARLAFPAAWKVLLVIPSLPAGLHGRDELEAFRALEPMPATLTDRLCRLVVLELLPAVAEEDLPAFGRALTQLQEQVGRRFAPAQGGGVFAHPVLGAIADRLRAAGLHGVGQSSWGPTLYAFWAGEVDRFEPILREIRRRYGNGPDTVFWTRANQDGTRVGHPGDGAVGPVPDP